MAVMGFMAKNERKLWRPLPANETLHVFDSGRAISITDAQMHIAITGCSGSGKTSQVIGPILDAAIANVPTLAVFDPKGTLGELVHGIASKYGREKDIVCFGTTPSATPLNIIEGMKPAKFFDFLMMMFRQFMQGGASHNMDFHSAAFKTAQDIFTMLTDIAEIARAQPKGFPFSHPVQSSYTLPIILDLLSDCKETTRLFQEYVKIAEKTPEKTRFIKRVQGNLFHVMNQTNEDRQDNDHVQQVSYRSHAASDAISAFLDEPGIVNNFCRPGAPGLDFSRCEGRINLFSFGAGAGGSAFSLCRLAQESFYEWVYSQGVGGKSKMIIGDEYQEFADLSGRKLSDTAFFALAREFLCGGVFAFQSYSALAARFGIAGLDGLLSNFSTKIFLRTEDPMTRDAAKSLGAPDLIDLQGEAFCVTFDSRTREYHYGLETMNDAYELFCSLPRVKPEPYDKHAPEHGVEDIAKTLDWFVSDKKQKYQEALEKEWQEETEKIRQEEAEHAIEKEKEDREWAHVMKKRSHMKMSDYVPDYDPSHYDETVAAEGEVPFWDTKPVEPEKPKPDPNDFRVLYSEFFDKDAEVHIPQGFILFVCRAFDLMKKMGLELSVERLGFGTRGELEAGGTPRGNVIFLNRFLSCTKKVCAQCGTKIEPNVFNLCATCSQSISDHLVNPPAKREIYHV